MVTRSLKEHVPPERAQIPAPRYALHGGQAMLNCEWGNEHPWTEWRDGWAKKVKGTEKPLIISLSGRDIEGCANLITVFGDIADGFEINVSCSHSGALHGNLNLDFNHLRLLFGKIRSATRKPIWLKLSYSPFVVEMAAEGEKVGADAIVCTNSIGPGLLIDVNTGLPKVGIKEGAGGVTGPAIFTIALRSVYEISKTVRIPVVGVGGISSADEVIQMMMAGASAVELYTLPALKGPKVFGEIVKGLGKFLDSHPKFNSLSQIVGYSHGKSAQHRFEAPVPTVIKEVCTGCGICIPSCAFDALSLSRTSRKVTAVIHDNCISCNACVGVCPPGLAAITTHYAL
jgi:dihydroorotate dehydrogenase/NAD-dependent dihydropyrimidine dehydrogenase PreA subunit